MTSYVYSDRTSMQTQQYSIGSALGGRGHLVQMVKRQRTELCDISLMFFPQTAPLTPIGTVHISRGNALSVRRPRLSVCPSIDFATPLSRIPSHFTHNDARRSFAPPASITLLASHLFPHLVGPLSTDDGEKVGEEGEGSGKEGEG